MRMSMSINLCQSITIQALTLQQRVQAINLLLDGLDNGMPGVCGPQEGIAKILKTMFRLETMFKI